MRPYRGNVGSQPGCHVAGRSAASMHQVSLNVIRRLSQIRVISSDPPQNTFRWRSRHPPGSVGRSWPFRHCDSAARFPKPWRLSAANVPLLRTEATGVPSSALIGCQVHRRLQCPQGWAHSECSINRFDDERIPNRLWSLPEVLIVLGFTTNISTLPAAKDLVNTAISIRAQAPVARRLFAAITVRNPVYRSLQDWSDVLCDPLRSASAPRHSVKQHRLRRRSLLQREHRRCRRD